MKILCTNNALAARMGSESYLETVAPALRQLGHQVEFYSPTCGAVAERLRSLRFQVHDDPSTLGGDYDVIHGQHVNALARVRARLPETPLVFATHSWFIPIEDPVAELGAAAFIAFNDITLERLRSHAAVGDRPVHRLRQPVEVSYVDGSRARPPSSLKVALVVSRTVRLCLPDLQTACQRHGFQLYMVGAEGSQSLDARVEMLAADVVVGVGRTALEGMAAGRAVLVLDDSSLGGWVTHESYDALEAANFTGLSRPADESLDELIGAYRPELGSNASVLAVRNHTAHRHAVELVGIYQQAIGAAAGPVKVDPDLVAALESSLALEWRAVHAEWALAQAHRDRLLLEQSRSWRMIAAARRVRDATKGALARGERTARGKDAGPGARTSKAAPAIDLTAPENSASARRLSRSRSSP